MKLRPEETLELVQKLIELLQMPNHVTSFTVEWTPQRRLKVDCSYIPESTGSRDIVEF